MICFRKGVLSVLYNAGIMTKVYFPRLLMTISGILSPLVDFFIAFIILILMMAYYGFVPTIAIVLLLLTFATSFAFGLWLSALNINCQDFYLGTEPRIDGFYPQKYAFSHKVSRMSEIAIFKKGKVLKKTLTFLNCILDMQFLPFLTP